MQNSTFLFLILTLTMWAGASFAQPFAYVTNSVDDTVTVINVATNTVVVPSISVGQQPRGLAITPDGSRVYVSNFSDDNISIIDTATNTVMGMPIELGAGAGPDGIVITPDGTTAYVVNSLFGSVSVIDTSTNMVITTVPMIGAFPVNGAMTPDGSFAYIVDTFGNFVNRINTATNMALGPLVNTGPTPEAIAITPDGTKGYTTNSSANSVTVFNIPANTVITTIMLSTDTPGGIAITPDGARAYVTNRISGDVVVIDTLSDMVLGMPIAGLGLSPGGIAITPDASRAYVANGVGNTVSVINTATNMVEGAAIPVGVGPVGIVITPDVSPPSADISLSPDTAENSVLTDHTVTALVEIDGSPAAGILVEFEVRTGPNEGETSSPGNGECFPNNDCTTDANGEVSWTYTGGPNPGTDRIQASFFNEGEQRTDFSNSVVVNWTSPISLSPVDATNEVRTEHTVTALIEFNGSPESGILVDFEIIAGPNFGEPGECSPNADCTTDGSGEVLWTYESGRRLGTDTIIASFFDEQFQARVDSNAAFKTWVLPERNIPTMSEWGMIATAAVLGLASILFLRSRMASA